MKELTRTFYAAFDGKEFASAADCKTYEDDRLDLRLVGLSIEQVRAALTFGDPDLNEVLERAGALAAEARKKAGVFRRRPGPRPDVVSMTGGNGGSGTAGEAGEGQGDV